MKRFTHFLLFLATLFISVSCVTQMFGENAQIVISATTTGYKFGNNPTTSIWKEDEQIIIFSSAYPFPATFTQISGSNSSQANFQGTITTQPGYIGIRPAALVSATTSQTISFSTKESLISSNIEELNEITPQIGKGSSKSGITFSPLFGAVEIPLSLKNVATIENITIALSEESHPLYGDFVYRFLTEKISSSNGVYEIKKEFNPALQVGESKTSLFIALPKGWYNSIKLIFPGYSSTENYSIDTGVFEVKSGYVTTTNPTIGSTPLLAGNWRLTSYSGTNEDIDVFLSMQENNSFTLYQRSDSMEYRVFTGTWSYDGATKILSGQYSDGASWSMSYYVSLSGDTLTLTSTTNANMVSTYTKTDATPNVSKAESRASIVKPFL